ncbi:MAG: LysR family transcriptional regulator [Mangrovicoccus sp.]
MDRLTEMEAFAAVVDQGGFTGAAKKLGVSKSAISKHVSSLETRLGVRLLNRTTRRVNPTEIGLVYYDRARHVLNAATEADTAVASLQAAPSGTLRMIVTADYGTTVLARSLGDFLSAHPDISLNLVMSNEYVEMVAEGYDLAIRMGDQPDSSLKARRIADVNKILVASPDYLAKNGVPQRIDDLAQHQLLHYFEADQAPVWDLISHSGELRSVRTRGRMAASCGLSLLEAARAGLGIAFLPEFLVAEHLEAGELEQAMPSLPQQSVGLYAVYPPGRFVQPKVRAMIDFLTEHGNSDVVQRRASA